MELILILTILVCASAENRKSPEVTSQISPKDNTEYSKFCEKHLCVPKCCKKGYFLFGLNKQCRRPAKTSDQDFSSISIYTNNLTLSGVLGNYNVTWRRERLLNATFNATSIDSTFSRILPNYYLTQEGILHVEIPNTYNRWSTYNWSQYCVDFMMSMPRYGLPNVTLRFLIYYQPQQKTINSYKQYGIIISVIFLALLLVVYVLLHELRNLSGKVLMAYVASLMGAFLLLFVILVAYEPKTEACKGLTYCIYFLLLASFCWMNVMSCDIWWTFRGYAKARPIHRRGENFKFGMYCIYGWGLPAALTVIFIVLNEMNLRHLPWIVKPNVPLRTRFIADAEQVLYLYIPMLILIICNWMFFLMTAFNIWRLHRATAVLDSAAAGTPAAHRRQIYRFLVYLKLSVIMGINWVLEIISYFSPNFQGWYISDIYNMLIGLSIFIIFVCKKSVLRKLRKRLSEYKSWTRSRTWHSRSRTSKTTESDTSTDAPVCLQPMGPASLPTPNGKQ